jgi:hypothetical protein
MLRIGADHAHHALAVNDLAVVTHFLYRCPDFHCFALPSRDAGALLRKSYAQETVILTSDFPLRNLPTDYAH